MMAVLMGGLTQAEAAESSMAPYAEWWFEQRDALRDANPENDPAPEVFIELLQHADSSDTLALAAEMLCRVAGDAQVAPLGDIVKDSDLRQAQAALSVLGCLGEAGQPQLIQSLRDPRPAIVLETAEILSGTEDPRLVAALLDAAVDAESMVRSAMFDAMGGCRTRSLQRVLVAAEPITGTPEHAAWERAIIRQARRGLGGVIREPLREILRSSSTPSHRQAAFLQLARAGDRTVFPMTCDAIGNRESPLHRPALRVIAEGGFSRRTGELAARIESCPTDEILDGIQAFATRGDRGAWTGLSPLLERNDVDVRLAIIKAAPRIAPVKALPELARAGAAGPDELKKATVMALAANPDEDADQVLLKLLDVREQETELGILAEVAGLRGMKEALPGLINIIQHQQGEALKGALRGLEQIATPQALAPLGELLASSRERSTIQLTSQAFIASARNGASDEATQTLLDLLPSANMGTREEMLSLLGRLGSPAGMEALLAMAQTDQDDAARRIAIRSLGNWPDASPAEALLKLAAGEHTPIVRRQTIRSLLELAPHEPNEEQRWRIYDGIRGLEPEREDRIQLISIVAKEKNAKALEWLRKELAAGQVAAEAQAAIENVESEWKESTPPPVIPPQPPAKEVTAWSTERWVGDPFFGDYALVDQLTEGPLNAAQVIPMGQDRFKIRLLKAFDTAEPALAELEGMEKDAILCAQGMGWRAEVTSAGLIVHPPHGAVVSQLRKLTRVSPTMGLPPPADAVVLFDGTNFDQWVSDTHGPVTWKITPEGYAQVNPKTSAMITKQAFLDFELHLEFRSPYSPGNPHQFYGNSGVFLQRAYEVQVLSNYGSPGLINECGAFYNLVPPLVNACAPPLAWQTYDIEFQAARFGAGGELLHPAVATVRHNGVVVHDQRQLPQTTIPDRPPPQGPEPLYLQDHHNQVQYRNIWIRARS